MSLKEKLYFGRQEPKGLKKTDWRSIMKKVVGQELVDIKQICCDECGDECGSDSSANINFNFGFESELDDFNYKADLCHECGQKLLQKCIGDFKEKNLKESLTHYLNGALFSEDLEEKYLKCKKKKKRRKK